MKILFYDVQSYDYEPFQKANEKFPEISMHYIETPITPQTVALAKGYDGVCAFVNSDLSEPVLQALHEIGIKLLLLRCAGFNNLDIDAAKKLDITVLRVPAYSPETIAEHAITLALCANRKIHKAYIRVRENNFTLTGLTGVDFYRSTAGIIGTGKIGAAMCRICHGFGMKILAYDVAPNPAIADLVTYCGLEELLRKSDLISIHCPLTKDTYHMIDKTAIEKMKDGVILVNTSRGGLVKTDDLIAGIRSRKIGAVGLDVYEEETRNVYENREDDILESSVTARLLSFPNVVITSHQGFLTHYALKEIAETTFENAQSYLNGELKQENLV